MTEFMENINKLMSVITVLNGIEVKGKANLMNLAGCISVIEEIYQNMLAETNKADK